MSWFSRARTFFREVVAEMKKVTFPSRKEVINTTIVVIITSAIFALYLFFADIVIVWLYEGINQVFG